MLIHIGYGNSVLREHVIGVVRNDGAAIRRYRSMLKDSHKLIDATSGHKTRSIIIMASDHIILSAIAPETLAERFGRNKKVSETEL